MILPSRSLKTFIAAAALAAPVTTAFAAGPIGTVGPNQPLRWPNAGVGIPFNPDQGSLGSLTNAEAVAQTESAFAVWDGVTTSTATFVNAGQLAFDVDDTNFAPFLFVDLPDGLSPIVYDAQGEIFTALFGPGTAPFILGFAGPHIVDPITGQVTEGFSFLNGLPLTPSSPFPFTVEDMTQVQVHEFGHYTGLGHTVVNGQVVLGDATGPSPTNTFPLDANSTSLEIMYPFLIGGLGGGVRADDRASISALYPAPSFAAYGSISGVIYDPEGVPFTGANVIARNIDNPFLDAVSSISSDYTNDYTPGAPGTGVYTIRGLTPGARYAVYIDKLQGGGFSTPKGVLPGFEEFYNGANESNRATDIPSQYTEVFVTAGNVTSGIDIRIAPLPPGPIPLGDEEWIKLPLGFDFSFCGTDYSSVFIHDNGFVAFGGQYNFSFIIDPVEFLAGLPRIAPMWADFNPAAAGVVSFSRQKKKSFTLTFADVPEWPFTGANSFSLTLKKDGSFRMSYGDMQVGGIAGYSCGGALTTGLETPVDLTSLEQEIESEHEAAIYEIFDPTTNDLPGESLRFERVEGPDDDDDDDDDDD